MTLEIRTVQEPVFRWEDTGYVLVKDDALNLESSLALIEECATYIKAWLSKK